VGRITSLIYARLEETSFRSGIAACAGVLVFVGAAIGITVTLVSSQAAPPRAEAAGTAPPPVASSSAADPSPSASH